MKLTQDQQDLLDGKFGEGAKLAMKVQVAIGESFGAERMVPIREPLGAPPCLGQTGEEQGAAEPCSCLYVHHAMHAVHCIAVHCILWTA